MGKQRNIFIFVCSKKSKLKEFTLMCFLQIRRLLFSVRKTSEHFSKNELCNNIYWRGHKNQERLSACSFPKALVRLVPTTVRFLVVSMLMYLVVLTAFKCVNLILFLEEMINVVWFPKKTFFLQSEKENGERGERDYLADTNGMKEPQRWETRYTDIYPDTLDISILSGCYPRFVAKV